MMAHSKNSYRSSKRFVGFGLPTFHKHNDLITFQVKNVDRPFTIILDDPLANSYLQNIYAPDPDPNMEIVIYDRTWDQNEDLGLNDMKVEGYEGDPELVNKTAEVKS